MIFLLLVANIAQAACPSVSFSFTGQPECVELDFTGDRTQLVNRCAHPILVDQSVAQASPTHDAVSVVLAGASAELRDLSAFTLGMEGRLYRAVAVPEESACGEPAAALPDDDRVSAVR